MGAPGDGDPSPALPLEVKPLEVKPLDPPGDPMAPIAPPPARVNWS